jgi:uncharacterized lipoprotein YddW (UPF0748 family)
MLLLRISSLVFGAIFVMSCRSQAAVSESKAPQEARGVWLHLSDFSADPGQGKREVREVVERLANANFNFIMPWVLSEYAAALTDTNYEGSAPTAKWDALGELTQAAVGRGLQVHLWYSFTYYKSPQSPDFNPQHGGNPSWAAWSLPDYQRHTNGMTDVCPLHPEARKWEIRLIESLLKRYTNISGIHIEEPGYGYPKNCLCELCRSVFKELHGQDLETIVGSSQAEDLRCVGTTEVIRELRERLGRMNPKPVLSVNGGSSWRNDRSLGRDWKRWAELGWLDFYAAQNYSPDLVQFSSMTRRILGDLGSQCDVFIGIGIKWSGGSTPLPVVLKQIEEARAQRVAGILFFSAKTLTQEYLDAFKAGPFKEPANFPARRVAQDARK